MARVETGRTAGSDIFQFLLAQLRTGSQTGLRRESPDSGHHLARSTHVGCLQAVASRMVY